MALQEEYEYAAFRCAFCNFFNPAKKLRPLAPRLLSEMTPAVNIMRPSTSSESSSGLFLLPTHWLHKIWQLIPESDPEISKLKSSTVIEELKEEALPVLKQSDVESESATDDMEILEKPEKFDIEKKLE